MCKLALETDRVNEEPVRKSRLFSVTTLLPLCVALSPLRAAAAEDQLLAEALVLVRLGGPVVLVLLAMSVISLAIALYKGWQIQVLARGSKRLEAGLQAWTGGEADVAIAQLSATHGVAGAILADGMRWLRAGRGDEAVREELVRRAEYSLARAGGLLGILEQVAYLAPLLGLLGTVLGIIDVFQGLASQGNDANAGSLAGGIWEALLTTAVGLCVAIPIALVHALLEGRIEQLRKRMEDHLTRLFTAALYRNE